MAKPLEGLRVVNLSINLPGPAAAMRLSQLGAEVIKIEPPSGDPLAFACRPYYDELSAGHEILMLDLKHAADRTRLDAYLASADLLLTAQRVAALDRLGLSWPSLHDRFPRLCHAALVAFPPPHDHLPGHDLMFQAAAGLIDPPHMPRTTVADLGAAERLVSAAVGLLLARARTGESGYVQVSIAEAGAWFALPARYGLTVEGPLSGALATYGLYKTKDGYIALAALEPHFRERLEKTLEVRKATRDDLERVFLTRTALEWESWAQEHNIPLTAVRSPTNE